MLIAPISNWPSPSWSPLACIASAQFIAAFVSSPACPAPGHGLFPAPPTRPTGRHPLGSCAEQARRVCRCYTRPRMPALPRLLAQLGLPARRGRPRQPRRPCLATIPEQRPAERSGRPTPRAEAPRWAGRGARPFEAFLVGFARDMTETGMWSLGRPSAVSSNMGSNCESVRSEPRTSAPSSVMRASGMRASPPSTTNALGAAPTQRPMAPSKAICPPASGAEPTPLPSPRLRTWARRQSPWPP